jgi:hypothetical protein
MSLDPIKRILAELHNKESFITLLEAVLSEGIVRLHDWETDPKFKYDHEGNPAEYKEATITAEDFVNNARPGQSISKSQYIFTPVDFALTPGDGAKMVAHIAALIKQNGSVTVTTLPGFGIEEDRAYAARWYKTFTHEAKTLVQSQLGQGLVLTAINGESLSRWLVKPSPFDTSDPETVSKHWKGGKVPDWLADLASEIDEAVQAGRVNVERITKIEGFNGDLALSTPKGDAVLLVSKDPSRAAYIVRKKIDNTDWDMWMYNKMKELYQTYRRKPAGTKKEDLPNLNLKDKRQPKLSARDELSKLGAGYALRRAIGHKSPQGSNQQMREEMKLLINNGVNFEEGRHLADTSQTPPQDA